MTLEITIRDFQAGDEDAFRRLNEEWIVSLFEMEAKDEEALGNPRGNILDRGGRIFLAFAGDEAVGCCALMTGPDHFEVAKMAVTKSWQRAGIGRKLLQAVIEAARAMGATLLFLETNHAMTPAIRLYESLGFQHIPHVPSPYARSDVSMELQL